MNLYSVISEGRKATAKNVRVLSPLLLVLVLPDAASPQVVIESGKPEITKTAEQLSYQFRTNIFGS